MLELNICCCYVNYYLSLLHMQYLSICDECLEGEKCRQSWKVLYLEEAYRLQASLGEWKNTLITWIIGWDCKDIIGELNCPHNQWERSLKANLRNLDFFFFFFLAALCDLWDFSSPTRDWTQAPQQWTWQLGFHLGTAREILDWWVYNWIGFAFEANHFKSSVDWMGGRLEGVGNEGW